MRDVHLAKGDLYTLTKGNYAPCLQMENEPNSIATTKLSLLSKSLITPEIKYFSAYAMNLMLS